MKSRVRVQKGELVFTSETAKQMFFERNEGKEAYLEIDDAPTDQMRRYFEGAIVPAVYYQHPFSGWCDFGDAREALKLEFLPAYTLDMKGMRVKIAKSTTDLSKDRFSEFLANVAIWLEENGLAVPDAEEYKAWRDSAPPPGEIYAPLLRMKQAYDTARNKSVPPTKKPNFVKK
jgi:hypothetical protein